MISNAQDIFLLRIEHLEDYIKGAKAVETAISDSIRAGVPNVDVLRNTLCYQREYSDLHYAAKIMSLYGFLERYVEDVIIEYVDCLQKNLKQFSCCRIPKYEEMVFAVGSKLGTHYKFNAIKATELIDSLQKSIREGTVSIIPDVFYSTSGNYNIKNIDDCFKRLGLEPFIKELWRWDPLNNYLKGRYHEGGFEREKMENLYRDIDDIVLRRNDIAHGKEITDRLSDNIILERSLFMRSFVIALNNKLDNYLMSLVWENAEDKYEPSKIRPRIKVIELTDIGKVYLKRGSSIIVKCCSNGIDYYSFAKVTDIQSEKGKQLTQIKSNGDKLRSFSIKLDISIKGLKEVCLSVEREMRR